MPKIRNLSGTRSHTLSLRAAAAIVGLSCLGAPVAADVVVGGIFPLSGGVAYDGQTMLNGATIAVERINAAGGINGEPFVLEVEDGACAPSQSVAAAEKLVSRDSAVALIGAFCSSSTGSVMEVARKYGIPHLTGVSTAVDLTERDNPWFFRATSTTDLFAASFAQPLLDTGYSKFAFIVENDDWGRSVAESYIAKLEELGAEITTTQIFTRDEGDMSPYITSVRSTDAEAIFLAASTYDASVLVTQLRQSGVMLPIMGEGSMIAPAFLDLVGELSEGIVGLVPYVPSVARDENVSFVTEYNARFDENPTKFSAAGYDSVMIMAKAIEAAGSTEPDAIRESLHMTDYEGLTGRFRFAENGQAYDFSLFMTEIKNGEPEIIQTTVVGRP